MDQYMERLRKNDPTLTTLNISYNYLGPEEKYIKYLVECNSVYQQLEKLGKIIIRDENLKALINSLFLSLSLSQFSLPNELRYEIAKEFILELKQNVK